MGRARHDRAVTGSAPAVGFVPPPYPYDRLDPIKAAASALPGGLIDLSIGTPVDPPPPAVVEALSHSGAERGYPPSIGSDAFRAAASRWFERRFGVAVPLTQVAACVGTKEFVATLPQWLQLRTPDRDTVLYPAISYPTYDMGAILAGCRSVPVPPDAHGHLDLGAIDPADAARALCLWVNSPANPTGDLDDLDAAAAWGRSHRVPVFSDECYAEFTWPGPPRTILSAGGGFDGLVAVHSLSKRSNFAGGRAGFYAGDADLVHYLQEVRKHVGMMVPGPVQAAAVAALDDDAHVVVQRQRYLSRLQLGRRVFAALGIDVELPAGGFYLWVPAPGGDAWALTDRVARQLGTLVSPGEFYGPAGADHVRVAMVATDDRLALLARRAGVAD
jgi:succinyldiaminopimelate transaminase